MNKQLNDTYYFTGAPENRITRRRNTMICYTEPSIRSLKPATDSTKEHQLKPTTPETTKLVTETTKSATKEVKIAKKKVIEPVDDADEPPTKRVTRAQLKECNIVLEKISDDASVESLTNSANPKKDGKGKRQRNEALLKKSGVKKAKIGVMKNINPELHSLKRLMRCLLCDKPTGQSTVNHYVNVHPDCEIVNSRLPPDVADSLRNSKVTCVAQRTQVEGRSYVVYNHPCYFCNVTKGLTKTFWMNHMAKHTGYYQYKCNDCSRTFAEKNKGHACKDRNNLSKIPQPQFQESTLKGFLCDLCNFFRFYQNEMEKHLRCEHELTVADKFKEITLIDFPKRLKKSQIEDDDDEEEEDDDEEEEEEVEDENAEGDHENVKSDDESKASTPKRRKMMTKAENTDKESSDNSSEKVLRSRVVHTEAFISEPKQDDGLFDKDTMKLMKDMSFSASKDGECTSRSNRAKSIAEKLSERFNSVQEDVTSKPNAEREAKIEPLDPLTCDEGIQIIRVTANEDCVAEETNVEEPTAMEISNGKWIFCLLIYNQIMQFITTFYPNISLIPPSSAFFSIIIF